MSKETTPTTETPALSDADKGREAAFDMLHNSIFGKTEGKETPPDGQSGGDAGKPEETPGGDDGGGGSADPEGGAAPEVTPTGDEAQPAPKPRSLRKQPKELRVTSEDLAKMAAEAAAGAVKGVRGGDQPGKGGSDAAESGEFSVPKEFEEDAEAYAQLATLYPEKYGEKAEGGRIDVRLREYTSKLSEYKKQWLKDNPGEKFDPASEEHEDWVMENYPVISASEMKRAQRAATEAIAERKAEEKIAPVRQRMEREEYLKKVSPQIQQVVPSILERVAESVAPGMGEKLKTAESFATLQDEDPALFDAIQSVGPAFAPIIQNAVAVLGDGGHVLFDPQNQIHQKIVQDMHAVHSHIVQTGSTEDNEGRTYVPYPEYLKLSAKDRKGHWTVDAGVMVQFYEGAMQSQIDSRYKHTLGMVEKYGGRKNERKQVAKAAPAAAAAPAKPAAPNLGATGPVATPQSKAGDTAQSGYDMMLKGLFPRG